MPSLLQSVLSLLGEEQSLSKLAKHMGANSEQAARAVEACVPAILGALADRATADGGLQTVLDLIEDAPSSADATGSVLHGRAGFFDIPVIDLDSPVAELLFGNDLDRAIGRLASKAELSSPMIDVLLPIIIPVVLSVVERRQDRDQLDGAGVQMLLATERKALEAAGRLEPAGDLVSLATQSRSSAGSAGSPANAAGPAKSKESARSAGTKASAERNKQTPAITATKAGGLSTADTVRVSGLGPEPFESDERAGLNWVGWAVGAVLLVLALAWLLSTCTGASDSSSLGNTVVEVDRPDGGDLAGDATETTTTPGSPAVTEPAPVETAPAEPAAAEPAAAEEIESEPVVAEPVEPSVADVVEEPASEVDPVDAEIQLSVDETLAGSAMVGLVNGGVVLLNGTAGSDGEVNDAVAALGVIRGVALVDDQVEVVTPPSDGPQPGSTINELIGLEPITFDYSSARITSAGRSVLDLALEFLVANPELSVEVAGHTDSDGPTEENLDLSRRRAESVVAYLTDQGIAPERLRSMGYGESKPLVPNDSLAAKASNRRIEFTIL